MKIRVEVDSKIEENEIIIKCKELNEEIKDIQVTLNNILSQKKQLTFYRGDTEYYLSLEEILFFETENNSVCAHTIDNIFNVKYKLYELEKFLPGYFMRISKSTILNTDCIYSIKHNISSSSKVEFKNTHKQVYISRYYYKPLKIKLLEKRK
ncbi:LytTR family DNA-binding domain-containing protein [Anaerovorax odorimutans]|uniref:LytTR family DNA-binding domain-containing protein n=1 Tax=Anaerovorax odorimutans TaxID=109327 RepID=UPI00041348FA|nr:LytTR family DNA-binding domain-containing protein [Anaerovorax odorimutans]